MRGMTKRIVAALALLAAPCRILTAQGATRPADSLPSGTGLSIYVGMFAPILSLVPVKNGVDPDVQLQSSPSFTGELTHRLRGAVSVYGAVVHVRTRVNHSSAMVFTGTDEQRMADSPVNITTPSAGFLYAPKVSWLAVRPTIRVGAGLKFYDFQMREVANGVQDPTADVGVGLMSVTASDVAFVAEGRWMPSKFDPTFLPIPLVAGGSQLQNDWVLHAGFRFTLRR